VPQCRSSSAARVRAKEFDWQCTSPCRCQLVFLAALRKGVKGVFRSTDRFSGVDFVCHGDLADNLVVGRVHQIDDLGPMEGDELAVDIGAIKDSYWSRGFMCFRLWAPFTRFRLCQGGYASQDPSSQFQSGAKAGLRN
jgi:hypothetical protein